MSGNYSPTEESEVSGMSGFVRSGEKGRKREDKNHVKQYKTTFKYSKILENTRTF
jgi:hypothetical protein